VGWGAENPSFATERQNEACY